MALYCTIPKPGSWCTIGKAIPDIPGSSISSHGKRLNTGYREYKVVGTLIKRDCKNILSANIRKAFYYPILYKDKGMIALRICQS